MLIMIGFSKGEAMTNDITGPKGAPAFSIPRVIGIVEQAQKGVKEPTTAPRKLPHIPRRESHCLSFSWGIYINSSATAVLIPRNRSVSSAVIIKKYCTVLIRSFILKPPEKIVE
jgi:hypothetical protein